MNVVKMLDKLEMVGLIRANGAGCRFVGIKCKTPVVKIKVGNPFGQIVKDNKVVGECKLFKVSKKSGSINKDFKACVDRNVAAAMNLPASMIDYKPGKVWYKHELDSNGNKLPLVVHAEFPGKYYLQYYPHKSVSFYVNHLDEVIPDELVKPWLHAESKRSEYKPPVISIEIANIFQLNASGVVVEMPGNDRIEEMFAEVLAD